MLQKRRPDQCRDHRQVKVCAATSWRISNTLCALRWSVEKKNLLAWASSRAEL